MSKEEIIKRLKMQDKAYPNSLTKEQSLVIEQAKEIEEKNDTIKFVQESSVNMANALKSIAKENTQLKERIKELEQILDDNNFINAIRTTLTNEEVRRYWRTVLNQ